MSLQIGQEAPDFSLSDENGQTVTLSLLRGRKVVLFFYPKDSTPGCTKEACDFRDNYARFPQQNIAIFGISKDSAKSHLKFKEKYGLPFPLLIDTNAAVCEKYGVVNPKSLFGKTFLGITRSTFLIDEEGKLEVIWRKVKVDGHVDAILNAIKESELVEA